MKKFLRITLKGVPVVWYDVPISDGHTMGQIVSSLQGSQYLCFDALWVPYGEIRSLGFVTVPNSGEIVNLRPVS